MRSSMIGVIIPKIDVPYSPPRYIQNADLKYLSIPEYDGVFRSNRDFNRLDLVDVFNTNKIPAVNEVFS